MYRIWDKKGKCLLEDFEECFYYITQDGRLFSFDYKPREENLDDYIVQQCTGKYSIDEDLIYEGDIVGIKMKSPDKMYKAIVKYGDCHFYFVPINENEWIEDWNLIDDSYRFEIIGNIMEDNNDTT